MEHASGRNEHMQALILKNTSQMGAVDRLFSSFFIYVVV